MSLEWATADLAAYQPKKNEKDDNTLIQKKYRNKSISVGGIPRALF